MALTCATGSIIVVAAPGQSTATVQVYSSSWSGGVSQLTLQTQWGVTSVTENTQDDDYSAAESGNWTGVVYPLTADKTYKFRAKAVSAIQSDTGTTKTKRSGAVVSSASTPTSSSVLATTATIACNYYPNVYESTCSAQLQYKKASDSTWTNAGTAGTTGGYSQASESENLTGLTASTQYQTRLVLTRTTQTDTSLTSATGTFTTLADDPSITTVAASSVGITGATLNATLDIGGESSVNVKWVYGTTNPPVAGVGDGLEVAYTGNPATASGSYSRAVTGLTASTTYYFFAKVYWNSDTQSATGSVTSFATAADPGAAAADQELIQVLDYSRKYGVATTVYFWVASSEAIGSYDVFYDGVVLWDGAGESKISKDGAAFEDTASDPVHVEGKLYSLALSATEMECGEAFIIVSNAGTTVRDVFIRIFTHVPLGSVDIDAATGTKADTTAFTATGYGSGHGISAVAGSTGSEIDGMASEITIIYGDLSAGIGSTDTTHIDLTNAKGVDATDHAKNDAHNGDIVAIVGGLGVGQARTIKDYVGATKLAEVDTWVAPDTTSSYIVIPGPRDWNVSPAVELAAVPTYASSYGALLQFLFQRFSYAHIQDAVALTIYKADGTTVLGTATHDDYGAGGVKEGKVR